MVRDIADPAREVVTRLRESAPGPGLTAAVDDAFAHCRALYGQGRSERGLAIARDVLEVVTAAGERVLMRRAAVMCGLMAADTGDMVGAIEHHVRALRFAMADDDGEGMIVAWNNIGITFGTAGNHENAMRCFRRALGLAEAFPAMRRHRHIACANLADSSFQLGRIEEGLRYAEQARAESTPQIVEADPSSAVIAMRTHVRLLVAAARMDEAEVEAAVALELAQRVGSPRARIVADLARASIDLARGHADVALTRMESALERARGFPGALRDALACVIRSEESAGHAARALIRLGELSELIYGSGIERARRVIAAAGFAEAILPFSDALGEQARERLESSLEPPLPPEGWPALRRLAAAAALRMEASGMHGMRVGALSRALAARLGYSPLQSLELGLACEVHDIGMLSVPEGVLAKRGLLNRAERMIVARHPGAGADMLCDADHPRMLLARDVARYHHARWDGEGNPPRVGAEFIPVAARICAVADAYDAMIFGFSGAEPRNMAEALQELRSEAGRQFDPELVAEFEVMVRDEMEGRGVDLGAGAGMAGFLDLVRSLTEDRGFV